MAVPRSASFRVRAASVRRLIHFSSVAPPDDADTGTGVGSTGGAKPTCTIQQLIDLRRRSVQEASASGEREERKEAIKRHATRDTQQISEQQENKGKENRNMQPNEAKSISSALFVPSASPPVLPVSSGVCSSAGPVACVSASAIGAKASAVGGGGVGWKLTSPPKSRNASHRPREEVDLTLDEDTDEGSDGEPPQLESRPSSLSAGVAARPALARIEPTTAMLRFDDVTQGFTNAPLPEEQASIVQPDNSVSHPSTPHPPYPPAAATATNVGPADIAHTSQTALASAASGVHIAAASAYPSEPVPVPHTPSSLSSSRPSTPPALLIPPTSPGPPILPPLLPPPPPIVRASSVLKLNDDILNRFRASLCLPDHTPASALDRSLLHSEVSAFVKCMRGLTEPIERSTMLNLYLEIRHPLVLTLITISGPFLGNGAKWVKQYDRTIEKANEKHADKRAQTIEPMILLLDCFRHSPSVSSLLHCLNRSDGSFSFLSSWLFDPPSLHSRSDSGDHFRRLESEIRRIEETSSNESVKSCACEVRKRWEQFDGREWIQRCAQTIHETNGSNNEHTTQTHTVAVGPTPMDDSDDVPPDSLDAAAARPSRFESVKQIDLPTKHPPPSTLMMDDTTAAAPAPAAVFDSSVAGPPSASVTFDDSRNDTRFFDLNEIVPIRPILKRRLNNTLISPRAEYEQARMRTQNSEVQIIPNQLATNTLNEFMKHIGAPNTQFEESVMAQLIGGVIPPLSLLSGSIRSDVDWGDLIQRIILILVHARSVWLQHWSAFGAQVHMLIRLGSLHLPRLSADEILTHLFDQLATLTWAEPSVREREWNAQVIFDTIVAERNTPTKKRQKVAHATTPTHNAQAHATNSHTQSASAQRTGRQTAVQQQLHQPPSPPPSTSSSAPASSSAPPAVAPGADCDPFDDASSASGVVPAEAPRSMSPQPQFDPDATPTAPLWPSRPIDPAACKFFNRGRCMYTNRNDAPNVDVARSGGRLTSEVKQCRGRHICWFLDCPTRFTHPHSSLECKEVSAQPVINTGRNTNNDTPTTNTTIANPNKPSRVAHPSPSHAAARPNSRPDTPSVASRASHPRPQPTPTPPHSNGSWHSWNGPRRPHTPWETNAQPTNANANGPTTTRNHPHANGPKR